MDQVSTVQRLERILKWFLPALLLLSIARSWLMPLPSSFWVDETATMFVVRQGSRHPSFAIAPQVPESLYYWLPRISDWFTPTAPLPSGWIETAYRLPSILCMALALFLLFRLSNRLIGSRTGWFAVFACLSMKPFNYAAADARPYALGILVATAAVLFLVRWLGRAHWFDAACFLVTSALLWPVHLIYWPFYVVFSGYYLFRLLNHDTNVGWPASIALAVLLGTALIPTAFTALALFHHSSAHVFANLPRLHNLPNALKFGLIFPVGLGAWLLRGFITRRWSVRPSQTLDRSTAVLTILWWLVPPLTLFSLSLLTGNSVFVGRYYSLALPGTALLATFVAAQFLPASLWKSAAAILGVAGLISIGQWRQPWPSHHDSDWRGAALAVNQLEQSLGPRGSNLPVICPSPYIEARSPGWTPDYSLPGFLYSHLATYPIGGQRKLFPFIDSPEAERYATLLVSGELASYGNFAIYGGLGNVHFWRDWFAKRPELHGWPNRSLGHFGDVAVILFTAPARHPY